FTKAGTGGGPGPARGPRLGVTADGTDTKEGVLISAVEEGSPAAKAGLKKDDRIVEFGDKPVKNQQNLVVMLAGQKPGDVLELGVMRDGKKIQAKAEFPVVVTLGIRLDYNDTKEGALVEGVAEGRPAAKAGLKAGDRIVELAGKPVKDVEGYSQLLGTLKP